MEEKTFDYVIQNNNTLILNIVDYPSEKFIGKRLNTNQISPQREGINWSLQDMLGYLRSSSSDFRYETIDLGDYGLIYGPVVEFEWNDMSVQLHIRSSENEARNLVDQFILDYERDVFSWGRFFFWGIDGFWSAKFLEYYLFK